MNNLTFVLVLLAAIGLCYAGNSWPEVTIEIKNPMASTDGATQLFNEIAKINGYSKANSSVPDAFKYGGNVEKLYINLGSNSPIEKAVMNFLGYKSEKSDDQQ